MKTPVPMPALIATIKSWKSANRIPKVEVTVQKPKEENRIAALEETVAKLTARVEELEAKLSEKNVMKLWVDADACPKVIRETIVRAAERTGVEWYICGKPCSASTQACQYSLSASTSGL